jgi:hypothetical protein
MKRYGCRIRAHSSGGLSQCTESALGDMQFCAIVEVDITLSVVLNSRQSRRRMK